MACNRPVLQYINEGLYSRVRMPVPPVRRIDNVDEIANELHRLADPSARERTSKEQLAYVRRYHNPTVASNRMAELYYEVIGDKKP
jgi:hypothetical protein